MITQKTAATIWNAYREIQAAEKLLEDMKNTQEQQGIDKHAPTLKDHFGHVQHLQLGIPSGENGHRLLSVSPVLAEAVIRGHIFNKQRELEEANICAGIELKVEV
jgi:hypothetical protein